MAQQDIATLKNYFTTGDKPTQQQFADLLDSVRHLSNKIAESDLSPELSAFLDSLGTLAGVDLTKKADLDEDGKVLSTQLRNTADDISYNDGSVKDAIDSIIAQAGSLTDLQTPDKTSLVAAINTLVAAIALGIMTPTGLDCSANPNYPESTKGQSYKITVAGKIGGDDGLPVQIGDLIVCTDANAGGSQEDVGGNYFIIQANVDVATDTVPGLVRMATDAEAAAGADVTAAVKPKQVKDALSPFNGLHEITSPTEMPIEGVSLYISYMGGSTLANFPDSGGNPLVLTSDGNPKLIKWDGTQATFSNLLDINGGYASFNGLHWNLDPTTYSAGFDLNASQLQYSTGNGNNHFLFQDSIFQIAFGTQTLSSQTFNIDPNNKSLVYNVNGGEKLVIDDTITKLLPFAANDGGLFIQNDGLYAQLYTARDIANNNTRGTISINPAGFSIGCQASPDGSTYNVGISGNVSGAYQSSITVNASGFSIPAIYNPDGTEYSSLAFSENGFNVWVPNSTIGGSKNGIQFDAATNSCLIQAGNFQLKTTATSSAGVLTVDASGNLKSTLDVSAHSLNVNGSLLSNNTGTGFSQLVLEPHDNNSAQIIRITPQGTPTYTYGGLYPKSWFSLTNSDFNPPTGSTSSLDFIVTNDTNYILSRTFGAATLQNIVFGKLVETVTTPQITIDTNNGYFGIGTTPAYPLDVVGNIRFKSLTGILKARDNSPVEALDISALTAIADPSTTTAEAIATAYNELLAILQA